MVRWVSKVVSHTLNKTTSNITSLADVGSDRTEPHGEEPDSHLPSPFHCVQILPQP